MYTAISSGNGDEVTIKEDPQKNILLLLVAGVGARYHGFGVSIDLTNDVKRQFRELVKHWDDELKLVEDPARTFYDFVEDAYSKDR